MRISTRLAISFTITTVVILGAYGQRQLWQEEDDLRRVAEEHLRLLGAAVAAGVEDALRDEQRRDVSGLLDSLEQRDPTVDVFVFDASRSLATNSVGAAPNLALAQAAAASALQAGAPALSYQGGLTALVLAIPLRKEGGTDLGSVVLVKPLDALRRDLAATRESTIVSIGTLILALSSVGWLLVQLSVRGPLNSLAAAMQAVQRGDLSARAAAERKDEVGQVARQFNTMVEHLDEAQRRLLAEVDSRRTLEKGLQRVDKLVTVGQLAAGLAHEIGSPLQILNGRARALAARSDVGSEVRRNADILVEQSNRVAGIVDRLLDFARRKSPQLTRVDMRSAVRAVTDLLEVEIRRRGIVLTFDCPPDLPTALADAAQVQQVALNLLSNALRATPKLGKVRVALSASSYASAGRVRASIELVVDDEGPGIADEDHERVFEPFYSTWAEAGGTGLGLTIVRSIVEEHEGVLALERRPTGGTHFAVHFPQEARSNLEERVA